MNILVEMVKYHTASSHLSALDYLGLILKLVSLKATFVCTALLYCRDLQQASQVIFLSFMYDLLVEPKKLWFLAVSTDDVVSE